MHKKSKEMLENEVSKQVSVIGITDLKAFVPAKDFAESRRFYKDIGFEETFCNSDVAEFQIGNFRFLLQNYFVDAWASNFMMQLMVSDVDEWWRKLSTSEATRRLPQIILKPPELQPWGLRVMYVSDPSGVLWHIAEPASQAR